EMSGSEMSLWERYRKYRVDVPAIGLSLDVSRMRFDDELFERTRGAMAQAFAAMDALERGAVANPDEKRMVAHYWLRAPGLAPTPAIRETIESTLQRVLDFAKAVHAGTIRPKAADRFKNVLVIGIGGSALGPQFVASALGGPDDPIRPFFFDNTDPDG